MWIWAVAAAAVLTVLAQFFVYRKHRFDRIRYTIELSREEVFEGDDLYFYETLENTGKFPSPYLKVSTNLPEGLEFILLEESVHDGFDRGMRGKRKLMQTSCVQSVFVLRPGTGIRRRWRIRCRRRGTYRPEDTIVLSDDLLGMNIMTKRIFPQNGMQTLVVLPRAEELDTHYTTSRYLCGDLISNHCPVADPLSICGIREYTQSDPMNKIHWMQSVAHGKMMVRMEEKTARFDFNLLLNMNTRPIELHQNVSSDTVALERCIGVCAALLDRIAATDIPVRMLANTDSLAGDALPVAEDAEQDPIGAKIYLSRLFRGRSDALDALRLLAAIQPTVSVPTEKMLAHIAAHPTLYGESRHFVVVSAYLDDVLLHFYRELQQKGYQVIFYLTTSRIDADEIPSDAEIYYKTY